jgi:hypothetical protein
MTALLRVLIYKIDNTTFGNNVPSLPQWTGPPQAVVHVQAILLASLAASLFSAFLAMLGKQWLNRYDATDKRGSAIERAQNRQQKLDGIVAWYFDHVLESLPLMLQAALLLLGCALSRYLWEVNTTIALVVIVVTSFGVILYLFIIIAGTASESCPYQTPGALIFRHILHHYLRPAFRSARSVNSQISKFSRFIQNSWCYLAPIEWWSKMHHPWYSTDNILNTLLYSLLILFIAPPHDAYLLGRGILRVLVAFSRTVCHQLLVAFYRPVYRWFVDTSPQTHGLDRQPILLDLRCISWTLQTSLDKPVRLFTLEHLATIPEVGNFDPSLVADCFEVFIGCINVVDDKVVIVQGQERLVTASVRCLFRTVCRLPITDGTLVDLRRRYAQGYPSPDRFHGSPIPFRDDHH